MQALPSRTSPEQHARACADATPPPRRCAAGNGHDTLALARHVGPTGTVHAFDVQAPAIAATRELVEGALEPGERPELHLHHACHSRLQEVVGSNRAVSTRGVGVGNWGG